MKKAWLTNLRNDPLRALIEKCVSFTIALSTKLVWGPKEVKSGVYHMTCRTQLRTDDVISSASGRIQVADNCTAYWAYYHIELPHSVKAINFTVTDASYIWDHEENHWKEIPEHEYFSTKVYMNPGRDIGIVLLSDIREGPKLSVGHVVYEERTYHYDVQLSEADDVCVTFDGARVTEYTGGPLTIIAPPGGTLEVIKTTREVVPQKINACDAEVQYKKDERPLP